MYEVIGRIVVWGGAVLVGWIVLGFVCTVIYQVIAEKQDGCWSHAHGRTNRQALFIGDIAEGYGFFPNIFAAPFVVPWGIYTLHRDGLYGERKKAAA